MTPPTWDRESIQGLLDEFERQPDLLGALVRAVAGGLSVDPDQVAILHDASDVDGSPLALHHTLGAGARQAAAGNHGHAASGPWSDYTPGIAGMNTLGNGARAGRYLWWGRLVAFSAVFTVGSTTTFNAGVALGFGLPAPARSVLDGSFEYGVCGRLNDTGTRTYPLTGFVQDGATVTGRLITEGGSITSTFPITLATGDVISCSGIYEADREAILP